MKAGACLGEILGHILDKKEHRVVASPQQRQNGCQLAQNQSAREGDQNLHSFWLTLVGRGRSRWFRML